MYYGDAAEKAACEVGQQRALGTIEPGSAINGPSNAHYNTASQVPTQKLTGAFMSELETAIHRVMSLSDRAEQLANRLLGNQPEPKNGAEPLSRAGILGEIGGKFQMLKKVTESLEVHLQRLELLA